MDLTFNKRMSKVLLEICCYIVQSVIIAEKEGADRIEFCTAAYEGGITPSYVAI
ncbi:copper homeostasis protein CutC [Marinifilum sp. RC60d5]|uniref:copper homeostasis protein CutC n=1 Tax=Marinifilum sp. RC60d5 TaxID=3458414 RepID=UPI0040352C09